VLIKSHPIRLYMNLQGLLTFLRESMNLLFDVELHLFSRYARELAEKNVTSHVTSIRPDVTAVQCAHTR
jgi:hypothetical protein